MRGQMSGPEEFVYQLFRARREPRRGQMSSPEVFVYQVCVLEHLAHEQCRWQLAL